MRIGAASSLVALQLLKKVYAVMTASSKRRSNSQRWWKSRNGLGEPEECVRRHTTLILLDDGPHSGAYPAPTACVPDAPMEAAPAPLEPISQSRHSQSFESRWVEPFARRPYAHETGEAS
jgi:hypothetical protein